MINLAEWDQQQIMDNIGMSATEQYFDSVLLRRGVGVPESKIAVFTGQTPYRRTGEDNGEERVNRQGTQHPDGGRLSRIE